MHLSSPISLLPNYTEYDLLDLGHLYESVSDSAEISKLRYAGIPKDELVEWFKALTVHQMALETLLPSISAMHTDNNGDIDRFEHLVIRDLDLAPFSDTTLSIRTPATSGRIVAHIAFKYISHSRDVPNPAADPAVIEQIPPIPPLPSEGNKALQDKLMQLVQSKLTSAFSGVKCYEIHQIATASTHYRKGIAKELLQCLFAFADADRLPVVLAATPPGYHLYKLCGFYEIGGPYGSVDVDLDAYGGEGLHQHILMVRWPKGSAWEGRDWYEYREQHKTR